jgi:hypothetical protein
VYTGNKKVVLRGTVTETCCSPPVGVRQKQVTPAAEPVFAKSIPLFIPDTVFCGKALILLKFSIIAPEL